MLASLHTGMAVAYQRYNDGYQNCHGQVKSGTSPKGTGFPGSDKHKMHRDAAYMATACELCHTSGDDRNPFIGSSNRTATNPGTLALPVLLGATLCGLGVLPAVAVSFLGVVAMKTQWRFRRREWLPAGVEK